MAQKKHKEQKDKRESDNQLMSKYSLQNKSDMEKLKVQNIVSDDKVFKKSLDNSDDMKKLKPAKENDNPETDN